MAKEAHAAALAAAKEAMGGAKTGADALKGAAEEIVKSIIEDIKNLIKGKVQEFVKASVVPQLIQGVGEALPDIDWIPMEKIQGKLEEMILKSANPLTDKVSGELVSKKVPVYRILL